MSKDFKEHITVANDIYKFIKADKDRTKIPIQYIVDVIFRDYYKDKLAKKENSNEAIH